MRKQIEKKNDNGMEYQHEGIHLVPGLKDGRIILFDRIFVRLFHTLFLQM